MSHPATHMHFISRRACMCASDWNTCLQAHIGDVTFFLQPCFASLRCEKRRKRAERREAAASVARVAAEKEELELGWWRRAARLEPPCPRERCFGAGRNSFKEQYLDELHRPSGTT